MHLQISQAAKAFGVARPSILKRPLRVCHLVRSDPAVDQKGLRWAGEPKLGAELVGSAEWLEARLQRLEKLKQENNAIRDRIRSYSSTGKELTACDRHLPFAFILPEPTT